MYSLKISETLNLGIEPNGKKIRLILDNGAIELACRKESISALKRFLSSAETQLFKGRLQLHKYEDTLSIILNGEPVGAVSYSSFEDVITANL